MKTADKEKLAGKMYPTPLDDNPDYEWDRDGDGVNHPPTLGQLASDITDNLEGMGDGKTDDHLGCICHGAQHLIDSFQDELSRAKNMIFRLKRDVDYAEAVFSDTCDCGECGPCEKRKLLRKHLKEAAVVIERLKLCE